MRARTDTIALFLGLATALIGGLAVIGHALDIPLLVRPWADTPATVLPAAVGLMLAGSALALAAAMPTVTWARAIAALGILVTLLGGLAAIERAFGMATGVDFNALHRSVGIPEVPGRMSAASSFCFTLLGVCLALLGLAARRRAFVALTIAATACAVLGAASVIGHLLRVEFMLSWPSRAPLPPLTGLGIVLAALGICRVLLVRARLAGHGATADESRAIQLTAVWTLSLIAVAAGISSFALAQYEYQDVVRADLLRTLRERRSFLEYAIRQHVEQVTIAAQPFAAALETSPPGADNTDLAAAAARLMRTGFSGWRFERSGGAPIEAGTLMAAPELTLKLVGPYDTALLYRDGYYLSTRVPVQRDGRLAGTIVAEEPFPELTRLKLEADSWDETGEMALCVAVDDQMDCAPLRSNPHVARYSRTVDGRALPMSRALDRETGISETLDYRQHRVLAAYGPVGFSGLGMVIKIDAAELNQPLGRRFGSAMALLFVLVSAGAWLVRRRLQPLTHALVDAREEARRVAAQFRAAAESSLDAYFIMDAVRDARRQITDFRVGYLNASGEVLVHRASEEVIGRTLTEILPPAQAQFFVQRYRRIVSTGESLSEEFRTDGEATGVSWVAHQAVKLGDGVSVTARDITQVKAVETQLRKRAENDVLTGLPNRTIFFDRLGRALADAREGHTGVAVLFLDLDRFKHVNDTHGHLVGDAVLREFATRLRAVVRASDTIARLGGDEFALMLTGLASIERAEAVATDIVAAIGVPFDVDGVRIDVGTSIGVAFSHDGSESPEALVGRADRKLYHAKSGGRGRVASAPDRHSV